MIELTAALAVFFVSHSGPALPRMRSWLISRFGRTGYLAAYAAVSLATVTWLIVAKTRAPYIALWSSRPWHQGVTAALMILASVFFVAAVVAPNPLSIGRPARPGAGAIPPVLVLTRHPLLWALGLWAAAHTLANGDLAALVLFAPLALFAVAFTPIIDRRRRQALGEDAWRRLAAPTANLPFAAVFCGRAPLSLDRDVLISLVGGVLLFVVAGALHRPILGVDPFGLLR